MRAAATRTSWLLALVGAVAGLPPCGAQEVVSAFTQEYSLDQVIAERIGHLTRFPSLTLGVNVQRGQRSLSWTSSGVLIPCEEKASDVFRRLFLQGSDQEVAAQVRKLELV